MKKTVGTDAMNCCVCFLARLLNNNELEAFVATDSDNDMKDL